MKKTSVFKTKEEKNDVIKHYDKLVILMLMM